MSQQDLAAIDINSSPSHPPIRHGRSPRDEQSWARSENERARQERQRPSIDSSSGKIRPQQRKWATHDKKSLVVAGIILVLVLGLITKSFARPGLIYQSSGTCTFGEEPAPCEHYVSPCVKGAEYFYFPSRGVLRTRDNRIVEVDT